jgi:hypothetical protein
MAKQMICKFCDAGDPTSTERYHKPQDCPSNQVKAVRYWPVRDNYYAFKAAVYLSMALGWEPYDHSTI